MVLNTFEWTVIGIVGGAVLGIIGYFLKRTMNTVDRHDTDINEIKRTYVTKDELKELKTELRDETSKLTEDVAEIKEHYIRRDDFYRTTAELKEEIRRVLNFLMQEKGGSGNGQE